MSEVEHPPFRAEIPGVCGACNHPIERGQLAAWDRKIQSTTHLACRSGSKK